jgi:hypothetical protein
MPKTQKRVESPKGKPQPESLKGWKQISEFLGEPVSVVKRWAAEGMPLHREGPFVFTSSNELNAWLGKESGKPVHVATENTDLTAELKRGLSFIRHEKEEQPQNKQSASSGRAKKQAWAVAALTSTPARGAVLLRLRCASQLGCTCG